MAQDAATLHIDAAPADVWALIGDFGGVDKLFALDSLELTGDDRILGMFGMTITERLRSRDDETMTLVYSVIDGVPVESHTGTITVAADGEGSLVTWAFDVTPDEMAPLFKDTYAGALVALANAVN
jgi:carbon monoxide dehydrogenase subunit G